MPVLERPVVRQELVFAVMVDVLKVRVVAILRLDRGYLPKVLAELEHMEGETAVRAAAPIAHDQVRLTQAGYVRADGNLLRVLNIIFPISFVDVIAYNKRGAFCFVHKFATLEYLQAAFWIGIAIRANHIITKPNLFRNPAVLRARCSNKLCLSRVD
jgi:hypothetical protein